MVGALAARSRLPLPAVWAAATYCLGSGIVTAILTGPGETLGRYLLVAFLHAGSGTVAMPTIGGGYLPLFGNLAWVLVAYVSGLYGAEGRWAAPRRDRPPATEPAGETATPPA